MKAWSAGLTVGLVVIVAACNATDRSSASTQAAEPAVSRPAESPAVETQASAAKANAPMATPTENPRVNPAGAATKAFLDRIQEYLNFHNNVEKMVPALTETSDPAKISTREKALGEALIKQRPDAKQGDFFIKEYQPILMQIIRDDFAKRPLADRKALIVELPKNVPIDVNMVYPTSLPLATSPANLLKALPELPPELEYRIVGRHLILLDVRGNVIVDLMRDVFPIPV